MSKCRPIIFTGESIPQILAGQKTQTRRVVKYISALGYPDFWCHKHDRAQFREAVGDYRRFCPYGVPGDTLYVKETLHQEFSTSDADTPNGCLAVYSADGTVVMRDGRPAEYTWQNPTLPSIFCPRWASRISLEVTDVRVQRIQDISEEDAKAEGVGEPAEYPYWPQDKFRLAYQERWDSLNAKRGHGWDANDWVWAVTFKLFQEAADG